MGKAPFGYWPDATEGTISDQRPASATVRSMAEQDMEPPLTGASMKKRAIFDRQNRYF